MHEIKSVLSWPKTLRRRGARFRWCSGLGLGQLQGALGLRQPLRLRIAHQKSVQQLRGRWCVAQLVEVQLRTAQQADFAFGGVGERGRDFDQGFGGVAVVKVRAIWVPTMSCWCGDSRKRGGGSARRGRRARLDRRAPLRM